MIRFSLAINSLLQEYELPDRIKIAADAGYAGIDIYGDHDARDADRIAKAAAASGIEVVSTAMNDSFDHALNFSFGTIKPCWEEALAFARDCGAKGVITFGGRRGMPADAPKSLIIENLRRVAPMAEAAGLMILLEPLNNVFEHHNVYLNTSAMGFEILKCVDAQNCKLAYDCYHMQATEGNILYQLANNLEWLGHMHCVGLPKHDEPFHSELNYPYILAKLDELGYDGFVAAEYGPSYEPKQSIRDTLAYLSSYSTLPAWENKG